MARRRSFPRGTSQRRRTGWTEFVGDFTGAPLTVTVTSVAIVGPGFEVLVDGITLVRTRGLIQLALTANTAAGDGFQGAFGICKVSADAFAVGVTAVPSPLDDMDWDGWLWYSFFTLIQGSVFSAQVSAGFGNKEMVIDAKAMRKVGLNETFILVGEFVETGTASMLVSADSRALFKLS